MDVNNINHCELKALRDILIGSTDLAKGMLAKQREFPLIAQKKGPFGPFCLKALSYIEIPKRDSLALFEHYFPLLLLCTAEGVRHNERLVEDLILKL